MKPKVLVLEDNLRDREPLVRMLVKSHFEVVESASMRECEIALKEHKRFSAILMDLGMPGPSGPENIVWIRSHYPLLPIWVVTGDDLASANTSLYDAGASCVVLKPWTSMHSVMLHTTLELQESAYQAGVGRKSMKSIICASAAAALTLASIFVNDPHFVLALQRATSLTLSLGIVFGADIRSLLGAMNSRKNNH